MLLCARACTVFCACACLFVLDVVRVPVAYVSGSCDDRAAVVAARRARMSAARSLSSASSSSWSEESQKRHLRKAQILKTLRPVRDATRVVCHSSVIAAASRLGLARWPVYREARASLDPHLLALLALKICLFALLRWWEDLFDDDDFDELDFSDRCCVSFGMSLLSRQLLIN